MGVAYHALDQILVVAARERLAFAEGQRVKAGEALCVIDAMKMENVLRAERNGRIARIVAGSGDSVSVDQVILEFE